MNNNFKAFKKRAAIENKPLNLLNAPLKILNAAVSSVLRTKAQDARDVLLNFAVFLKYGVNDLAILYQTAGIDPTDLSLEYKEFLYVIGSLDSKRKAFHTARTYGPLAQVLEHDCTWRGSPISGFVSSSMFGEKALKNYYLTLTSWSIRLTECVPGTILMKPRKRLVLKADLGKLSVSQAKNRITIASLDSPSYIKNSTKYKGLWRLVFKTQTIEEAKEWNNSLKSIMKRRCK